MNRRAKDGLRYKEYQSMALGTGVLPPAPPSIEWYIAHPDYVWSPSEPNPEKPAPIPIPRADFTIYVNNVEVTKINLIAGTPQTTVVNAAMQNAGVSALLKGKSITGYTFQKDKALYLSVSDLASAQDRRIADLERYRVAVQVRPGNISNIGRRVPQVPSLQYYMDNEQYVWDINAPQVIEKPKPVEPVPAPELPEPETPAPEPPKPVNPPPRPI
jgi:hypothetical protein